MFTLVFLFPHFDMVLFIEKSHVDPNQFFGIQTDITAPVLSGYFLVSTCLVGNMDVQEPPI